MEIMDIFYLISAALIMIAFLAYKWLKRKDYSWNDEAVEEVIYKVIMDIFESEDNKATLDEMYDTIVEKVLDILPDEVVNLIDETQFRDLIEKVFNYIKEDMKEK